MRYATSTEKLMFLLEHEKNPVTRAVYRQIIGRRIDRGNISGT